MITATNRDLETMVAEGRIAASLLRLNVFTIRLPPLRSAKTTSLIGPAFVHRFAQGVDKNVQVDCRRCDGALKHIPGPATSAIPERHQTGLLQATGPVLLPEFFPDVLSRTDGGEGPNLWSWT